MGLAWDGLSIVVDGVAVKSAVIAGFSEGILAYWPPSIDESVLGIFNKLYLHTSGLAYLVLYIRDLDKMFLIIINRDKMFALEVDKRLDARKIGEKMLRIFESVNRLIGVEKPKPREDQVKPYYEG